LDSDVYVDGASETQKLLLRCNYKAFATAALKPFGMKPALHHRIMISALQDLADGVGPHGLIIEMPPGSAKSTYASILFAAFWLARFPDHKIIAASSTSQLAEKFSKKVQQIITDMPDILGCTLKTEPANQWETNLGGEYAAVGIGGSAQGLRANLFNLDDPFKSRKDADSLLIRDAAWDWWQSVVEPRMKPGGKKVITTTRWHKDDLVGRILAAEPYKWRRLRLRAQAMADEEDPLGRKPGEFMWEDDDYGYGGVLRSAKERLEKACAMREWWALYQQEPRPPEGAMFDVAKMIEVAPLDPYTRRKTARAWDFGGTDAKEGRDPDYTAGVKIAEENGRFYIEDVVRFRGNATEVDRRVRNTAATDGKGVTVVLPRDPAAAGKARVEAQVAMLAGYVVKVAPTSGSKETRATPFASQVGGGTVSVCRGEWNKHYIEELRDFPYGDHDDQIDASSDGFNALLHTARQTETMHLNFMER
jgi:predicted phage terminase large subunit-like protein